MGSKTDRGRVLETDEDPVEDRHEGREEDLVEWIEEGDEEVEDNDRLSLSLVGKLWSNRVPNLNAFIATMKGVWLLKHGVEISNIGRNLFIIQFFHWRDKQRNLDGQSWHFDKFPLLLAEIDGVVKASDLDTYHIPLWARFYDISFRGRGNMENAKMLGNKLGKFLKVTKTSRCGIDKSLRVKVMIDVRNPLKDSVSLKFNGITISRCGEITYRQKGGRRYGGVVTGGCRLIIKPREDSLVGTLGMTLGRITLRSLRVGFIRRLYIRILRWGLWGS